MMMNTNEIDRKATEIANRMVAQRSGISHKEAGMIRSSAYSAARIVLEQVNAPIRVRCSTNLDEYRGERWPETFAAPPVVGEWVTAQSGKVLRISSLRHASDEAGPLLIVDLHR